MCIDNGSGVQVLRECVDDESADCDLQRHLRICDKQGRRGVEDRDVLAYH